MMTETPRRGRPPDSSRIDRTVKVTPGVFDRDVYSSKELGAILGVSFEYVLDEIARGRLLAIKLGGAGGYRIRHDRVMEWLDLREREHQAEVARLRDSTA